MRVTTRVVAAAFATLAFHSRPLPAQGWIEPIHPANVGSVVKLRSAVSAVLRGRVARVTVEEWFENRGPGLGEGVYHYPLPGEAVFSSFSLWQGDAELRGETMDAREAQAVYEDIVRRRRDPALIELAGHGLVRARIFPIQSGETRKITLRYDQILDREGDAWRFRSMMGAGPGAAGASRSFRLTADSADRFGEPYSPTHQVRTHRSNGRLEVTLADSTGGVLDLFLPLVRGRVGMSLITHRPVGEDGYFMLLLAPGPAAPQGATIRRDVVAVLDVSGSMSGEKLTQAGNALEQLLGSLRSGDRFRLIAFESAVRRFAADWTVVDTGTRHRAVDWVRALAAGGGTNIAGALDEAFRLQPADGALGVVVFLTDGLPTVGERDPERIAARAEERRGGFRAFSFGIGYDVNTYLLDRLTEQARGATTYITPGGDIEQSVGALTAKIASPLLTDVRLAASDGVELFDLQPGAPPDLFAGDELVLFGRYRGAGRRAWSVTVEGRRHGTAERFGASATVPGSDAADAYIPRLWAARKAGALSREMRLHGQTPELMAALKDLALRYGILTEYTAYLVQEPPLVADGHPRWDRRAPAPTPAAPRDQSGADAVGRAMRESQMASASVVAAAHEAEPAAGTGSLLPTRRLGGRLFVQRDGVWTDLRHADSLRIVPVAPFSDAYFALLRACPELAQPAALAPVLVAGRRVSIKIAAGGRESLEPAEVTRLVAEFRE
jgi:Ca-activated chloride channel family protein